MQYTLPSIVTEWRWALLAGFVAGYLALVAGLRHGRARDLSRRFNMTRRVDFSRMTADEAQAILQDLTELEFPKLMGFSIVFALFKVHTPHVLLPPPA